MTEPTDEPAIPRTSPPGVAGAVLLTGIGQLVTNEVEGPGSPVGQLGIRTGHAMVLAAGHVAWIGPAARAPAADTVVDCRGASVIPGFVDSHSHPVFAGDRLAEFTARMSGQPYRAGGIADTVDATRRASDAVLAANLRRLAREMLASGITTFEAKSGYGLAVDHEERALRLAAALTPEVTFLGAHVVPGERTADRAGYVAEVCGPMLAAAQPHSRWIDVFCERGAFDAQEARQVLAAGMAAGLGGRIHANQLANGPGVEVGVRMGAASVDHCTYLSTADLDLLSAAAPGWFATGPPPAAADPTGGTVAALLPAAEFSTRSAYANARQVADSGGIIALATDCNPGSSYTTSMPLVIALAVREYRLTPAEALWAATAGGAVALRRSDVGVLRVGARADLVVLAAPDFGYLAYRPGVALVRQVWRSGELVHAADTSGPRLSGSAEES